MDFLSIMCSSISIYPLFHLLLIIITCFASFVQPLCHNGDSIALLEFKSRFIIHKFASINPFAYPKVSSWRLEENRDCCSWDGVECDDGTGRVVALDLSSSFLYGSTDSSSTLFNLSQLQRLNLADNYFNFSQIPSAIGRLSRLTYLNLSSSFFYGQVPLEMSQLSNLSVLDLSYNNFSYRFSGLVPYPLGKLTRLTYLDLSRNNFEGQILSSLQNLTQLTRLQLGENQFTGEIPSWLENFTLLTHLSLQRNKLQGLVPSSLGRLTSLTHLDLSMNNFKGRIPCFLQNLTQLTELNLGTNEFSGHIPSCLGNLSRLTGLILEKNRFHGFIPHSFTRLTNLKCLSLCDNELSGTLKFDMFLGLKNLDTLLLSRNKLSVLSKTSKMNATFPRFQKLGLSSCNLTKFPYFLRYQNRLVLLVLTSNHIHGQIPKWIWNISTKTMAYVDISNNSLTGFDQPPVFIPWVQLLALNISFNRLKGQLPIPPPSIIEYVASNNKLSGEISPFFCNLSSLLLLDLSNNQLTGILRHCFGNLSKSLLVLDMSANHFHGSIPQMCANGSKVRMIDLSHNQFQGRLPQMLANCMMLEFLNLGNNQFNDAFPSWLGTLPKLRLLILRSNSLHGVIRKHNGNLEVSSLRVFDLSNNSFTGKLPSEYFKHFKSMKVKDAGNSSYLVANWSFVAKTIAWSNNFTYSMTITCKGRVLLYEKIQEVFSAIDLSSNRFEGSIPQSLGFLQGLHVLNLSNNFLSGKIPSSLGNATELESLDVSNNKLSGQIPPQLAQLTFLQVFMVSHNHLTGAIPQMNQLSTFDFSSYEGNLGLCGNPMPRKCGSSSIPLTGFEEEQDSKYALEFHWMTIVPGYVSGLVTGVVFGQSFATKKH